MRTKSRHTVVVIPNESKLEVSYYCSDTRLDPQDSKHYADLVIQMNDCHSYIKIPKALTGDEDSLEAMVQRTVINAQGHLCD